MNIGDRFRAKDNLEIRLEQERIALIVGHVCGPECRDDSGGPVLQGRRDEPRTEGRR